jgi:hypothetical protein
MSDLATEQRLVQVWFGETVIASYKAEPADAERYAEAMDRRFAGLRITNEALRPLPAEILWTTIPH